MGPMSDVFVSYKQEDRARAAKVVHALEAEGLTVWWDQHIEPGAHWRESIVQALSQAKCVLVLWTEISVQAQGRFVHDEASHADRRGVYLPARLDAVDLPLGFGQQQCLSLIGWKGDRAAPQFQTLMTAVRAMVVGEARPRGAHQPARRARAMDRRLLIGGGVAALGVAGLAAGAMWAPRDLRCRVGLCEGAAEPSAIAVLPFRNLSGDPKQGYLCEGLSEELRDALSRLGSIRVAARASSEAFAGSRSDTAAIADKLGVAYILDGSVRTSGQMLRVSAQLIDAKSGLEKWSQSFDRTLTDVITVQAGIAANVAESLRGALSTADAALIAKPATAVPAAFDALLRGRQIYLQSGDEASEREALRLFDLAIAADPNYAEAHAYRALVLMVLADQFAPPAQVHPIHEQAVAAALRLWNWCLNRPTSNLFWAIRFFTDAWISPVPGYPTSGQSRWAAATRGWWQATANSPLASDRRRVASQCWRRPSRSIRSTRWSTGPRPWVSMLRDATARRSPEWIAPWR